MDKLKDLNCIVEDEYFLGIIASKDTVLGAWIEVVNQLLEEEFGDEFKVVEYIHKDEPHNLEDYYVLKTNLPYNLFSLRDNNSIPEYMLHRDGWLSRKILKELGEELIFRNDCLNTGNYKNKYGLDEEEVKTFFKDY